MSRGPIRAFHLVHIENPICEIRRAQQSESLSARVSDFNGSAVIREERDGDSPKLLLRPEGIFKNVKAEAIFEEYHRELFFL